MTVFICDVRKYNISSTIVEVYILQKYSQNSQIHSPSEIDFSKSIIVESQNIYIHIAKQDINAPKPQEIVNLPPAIYSEIRDLQKQINQEGPQVPNQVDETMHQRQPPPSNANTTEQPPVQAEGNNEQKGTEREPVSKKQVSESGETGPLTSRQPDDSVRALLGLY
ncbi:Hypothetical_protein [Hexamita inflata]|uniref:Hypothetical_protein n=1 Tax=Hexamita inflata TaxID=28002 RepID=A0ABP1H9A2_9EUKA